MKRIIEASAANAFLVLAVLILVTVVAAFQLPKITIDVSPEGLMASDTPDRDYHERVVADFGTDNVTVVVIKDDELQSPEVLNKARSLVDKINQLDFIAYTESLFTAQHIQTRNDSVQISPYLHQIPDDSDKIKRIFRAALKNPLVADNLLADDRKSMAINIYLDDADLHRLQDSHIANEIGSVLQTYEGSFDEVYQMGLPYVRHALEEQILSDQLVLLPQSLLVLLVVLIIILRNINAGVIPLFTSLMSIIWILGLMVVLDIPLTLVTAIVPVLLVIIGSTEDVHLISEYLLSKQKGRNRTQAVADMARKKGFASLMTFVTTWFGFISVAVNPLEILREFSIIASSGMLINYLVTMSLVPAWICIFGSWKAKPSMLGEEEQRFKPLLKVVSHIVHNRKTMTLSIIALLSIIGMIGATHIQLNNNVMAYFDDESLIKQRANDIAKNLAGIESFMVVMGSGIEGTFLNENYLTELDKLKNHINQSPYFDKATAFSDYMALLNSTVNETNEITLPDENYIINELSIFIDSDDVSQMMSPDYSTAVISVRHSIGSSYEFNQALDELRSFIEENIDPALQIRITGESILVNNAADQMALGQAKSLLLILLIIFIVVSLIFWNPAAGLAAIVPNIVPIIALFGVMGFAGIPLDTGTAMIAVIAIGIIIDDTMHFMVRYNNELKATYDEETAISNTLKAEALPIISTSVALALGFLVLIQSSFVPIVSFAALSAMVIVVALLAEFLLTPILLSSIRLVTLWDILSLDLKKQLLANCRLFTGMRAWQIKKLILLSQLREYSAGETIMKAGDPASEMYILLEGAVDITFKDESGETVVNFSPESGRLFGMMRLHKGEVRATSAIAKNDSRVLIISWKSIERIARFYPRISSLFFKNLSALLGGSLIEQLKQKVSS